MLTTQSLAKINLTTYWTLKQEKEKGDNLIKREGGAYICNRL